MQPNGVQALSVHGGPSVPLVVLHGWQAMSRTLEVALKLTHPLKMDDSKMKSPFGMAYFQGRTVSFRGSRFGPEKYKYLFSLGISQSFSPFLAPFLLCFRVVDLALNQAATI